MDPTVLRLVNIGLGASILIGTFVCVGAGWMKADNPSYSLLLMTGSSLISRELLGSGQVDLKALERLGSKPPPADK